MCVQTRTTLLSSKEMFLRQNQLFSLLICETYNTLTYFRPTPLTPTQIFNELSPFLKARIQYVIEHDPITTELFTNEDDIVAFVVALLTTKIEKIKDDESKGFETYYCS